MAEKTFIVKRGWLIAKDAFGNMLPFFLHVRDKDIVWQSKHHDFITKVMKDKDIRNIEEVSPRQILHFTSGIWSAEVDYTRKACILRACMDFDVDTFTLNSAMDDLYTNLNLPLALTNDSEFFVQTTLCSENEQIMLSTVAVTKVVDSVTKMIHNLSLHVRNSNKFPATYYNMDQYKKSNIYVEIRGKFIDY